MRAQGGGCASEMPQGVRTVVLRLDVRARSRLEVKIKLKVKGRVRDKVKCGLPGKFGGRGWTYPSERKIDVWHSTAASV
eukprot:scaffold30419_cov31-Tisochrysis_lutea.AAC.3